MIGLIQRPRGLFGNPMDRYRPPYATPGIGDGMNEPNPMMSAVRAPSPQQQPEPRQPRRMDEKLYALGGLLANVGGIPNNAMGEYMAGQRNREQAALQAQAEQMAEARKRAMDRADKEWEWRNKPNEPEATTFQRDYQYILENFGPEAAQKYRDNKIDPPVWRPGPDGRFYRVDTAQPQVLGDTLPEGWSIQGDAGSNASGGF